MNVLNMLKFYLLYIYIVFFKNYNLKKCFYLSFCVKNKHDLTKQFKFKIFILIFTFLFSYENIKV